ncbi:Polyadenylation specificity factor family protein [Giardia muris]|uniref:Polyadenylation specificity factor family protein n=1 Tax=Giardia muris TaxID=5742 RepID=A0A4Z1TCM8_GIAMU|nr:Polyadenylation specificity factor family protein [Giardia muris]|eukprot:TNJ30251.1 Polyadenylation specificity factor family protein [Giardia muris]
MEGKVCIYGLVHDALTDTYSLDLLAQIPICASVTAFATFRCQDGHDLLLLGTDQGSFMIFDCIDVPKNLVHILVSRSGPRRDMIWRIDAHQSTICIGLLDATVLLYLLTFESELLTLSPPKEYRPEQCQELMGERAEGLSCNFLLLDLVIGYASYVYVLLQSNSSGLRYLLRLSLHAWFQRPEVLPVAADLSRCLSTRLGIICFGHSLILSLSNAQLTAQWPSIVSHSKNSQSDTTISSYSPDEALMRMGSFFPEDGTIAPSTVQKGVEALSGLTERLLGSYLRLPMSTYITHLALVWSKEDREAFWGVFDTGEVFLVFRTQMEVCYDLNALINVSNIPKDTRTYGFRHEYKLLMQCPTNRGACFIRTGFIIFIGDNAGVTLYRVVDYGLDTERLSWSLTDRLKDIVHHFELTFPQHEKYGSVFPVLRLLGLITREKDVGTQSVNPVECVLHEDDVTDIDSVTNGVVFYDPYLKTQQFLLVCNITDLLLSRFLIPCKVLQRVPMKGTHDDHLLGIRLACLSSNMELVALNYNGSPIYLHLTEDNINIIQNEEERHFLDQREVIQAGLFVKLTYVGLSTSYPLLASGTISCICPLSKQLVLIIGSLQEHVDIKISRSITDISRDCLDFKAQEEDLFIQELESGSDSFYLGYTYSLFAKGLSLVHAYTDGEEVEPNSWKVVLVFQGLNQLHVFYLHILIPPFTTTSIASTLPIISLGNTWSLSISKPFHICQDNMDQLFVAFGQYLHVYSEVGTGRCLLTATDDIGYMLLHKDMIYYYIGTLLFYLPVATTIPVLLATLEEPILSLHLVEEYLLIITTQVYRIPLAPLNPRLEACQLDPFKAVFTSSMAHLRGKLILIDVDNMLTLAKMQKEQTLVPRSRLSIASRSICRALKRIRKTHFVAIQETRTQLNSTWKLLFFGYNDERNFCQLVSLDLTLEPKNLQYIPGADRLVYTCMDGIYILCDLIPSLEHRVDLIPTKISVPFAIQVGTPIGTSQELFLLGENNVLSFYSSNTGKILARTEVCDHICHLLPLSTQEEYQTVLTVTQNSGVQVYALQKDTVAAEYSLQLRACDFTSFRVVTAVLAIDPLTVVIGDRFGQISVLRCPKDRGNKVLELLGEIYVGSAIVSLQHDPITVGLNRRFYYITITGNIGSLEIATDKGEFASQLTAQDELIERGLREPRKYYDVCTFPSWRRGAGTFIGIVDQDVLSLSKERYFKW